MREGDTLEQAIETSFSELDGFFTLLMATGGSDGAGARRVRLQAGRRRRNRRLRGHRARSFVRWPICPASKTANVFEPMPERDLLMDECEAIRSGDTECPRGQPVSAPRSAAAAGVDAGRDPEPRRHAQHRRRPGCDVDVDILGHAGYFIAGMNKQARVTVHGNVGWSVAENIMSGGVRVKGNASECAGASGHGGLVVIEGDASRRCGISMKGCDIVVGGSVGHVSAFMAQAGTLVVCGDAGPGLGDSLYEAVIYVRGKIHSLGADAREEPMSRRRSAAASRRLLDGRRHAT